MKKTVKYATVFRKAAELLFTPIEYSAEEDTPPMHCREYYSCFAIDNVVRWNTDKAGTKYTAIMIHDYDTMVAHGWFGDPAFRANREKRAYALLLAAEFCGNETFTYEN